MGDVFSLIEKAQEAVDEDAARELSKKVKKADFDFNDYLLSMEQMKKMGGLASVLGMLPSMPGVNQKQMKDIQGAVDEKQLLRTEAIIHSMTKEERANPDILNPQRKNRIARGAGVDIAVVNRFIKQFNQSKKLMKQFKGKKGKRHGGFPGMPF